MTKQQQEAYNKFLKALELQEQGMPRQEIYKQVGYASLDSLTKAFRKQGYKYSDDKQKYVQVSNTTCNTDSSTESNTNSNTQSMDIIEVHSHTVIDQSQLEFISLLEQEEETIKNMIDWYKRYSNTDKTSNTLIKIELPQSENVMITVRSSKTVWDQFRSFAKSNSANFKMGDLLAQALLDFMKKHT